MRSPWLYAGMWAGSLVVAISFAYLGDNVVSAYWGGFATCAALGMMLPEKS